METLQIISFCHQKNTSRALVRRMENWKMGSREKLNGFQLLWPCIIRSVLNQITHFYPSSINKTQHKAFNRQHEGQRLSSAERKSINKIRLGLDRGSIRSSLRDGLSNWPRNSVGLLHHVHIGPCGYVKVARFKREYEGLTKNAPPLKLSQYIYNLTP